MQFHLFNVTLANILRSMIFAEINIDQLFGEGQVVDFLKYFQIMVVSLIVRLAFNHDEGLV